MFFSHKCWQPGKAWEYSDAAFAHLSLIFAKAAGREIADYMKERVSTLGHPEHWLGLAGWRREHRTPHQRS